MESPQVSLVIRCYNEREHIGKLLHGIFEQRHDDFEVILVDSGSTDGTLELANEFPIDEVVYISPDEFSFGRALNRGCEAASGGFCVFASAHVYPTRVDWLETLLEKFDDDVALVYGKQRGNDVTKFPEKRVFKRWFPDEDADRQSSPFCNNANAAIRREVWEEFEYDETLTGLEDLDWAKRVQEAGWEISYASDAEIIHVHDETPREVYNRYRREAIAHKQIFSDQEFSFGDFVRMFGYNTVADYVAAVKEGELLNNVVSIPRFRLMQFWGTYRGFSRQRPVSDRLWRRFYYPDTQEYPKQTPSDSETVDTDLHIDYPESVRGSR
jgi:glycosyltransferase involved in cell wall biosynthesis